MKNYNPYLKFLKTYAIKVLIIATIIILGNVCISAIVEIVDATSGISNDIIKFASPAESIGLFMCILYGLISATKSFSGAMNIRGNRIEFLKAFAIWAVLIALFISVFTTTFETGYKLLLESISNRDVLIVGEIAWFNFNTGDFNIVPVDISFMWFIKTILSRLLTNTLLISLGFMFGAIGYRLKLRTNLILFVIIPILAAITIVSVALKNEDIIIDIVYYVMNIVLYVAQYPIILVLTEIAGIAIFTLISVKFLIKAPIKDYAHDLA